MTGIFAVPRALIYWKREYARIGEFGPTGDLTIRIYRFSLGLGVIAILSGIYLFWWWGWPVWAWVKLGLVTALAAHYGWTGKLVLRARKGQFDESDFYLRVFNEISVLAVIVVLYLVVFKPF
ncbi:Protoporphyrinogen IX oxidase, HemJ [Roseibacterium elongatum DSM 19469]|uniref:Protoporphyrinogen IX oxidase n=2 Tax=Roseicyclus elongatus TaxID=159346 RepID=W8S5B7_9RHOB|nr:Protoporphyrinogen IX oxidase, HemJ [Roseibacterium elongatum DSM 19469]